MAGRFMTKDTDTAIREYLSKIGREGGRARAERHSKAELGKWAKLGGRPLKPWSQLSESGKRARKRRAEKSVKGE
jgi:hypothetical protein